MADQIRVNGNICDWGSITLRIDDEVFTGFTSISYADKRERAKAYGLGKHHAPRARTRGKYSVEAVKLAGPKSTMHALRRKLASKSPDGNSYGDYEFHINTQYIEPGEPEMYVDIERCVYVGTSSSEEESPDFLKEEIEIDAMSIRRNGMTLFDGSGGAP
jgi:hypothetical protein